MLTTQQALDIAAQSHSVMTRGPGNKVIRAFLMSKMKKEPPNFY